MDAEGGPRDAGSAPSCRRQHRGAAGAAARRPRERPWFRAAARDARTRGGHSAVALADLRRAVHHGGGRPAGRARRRRSRWSSSTSTCGIGPRSADEHGPSARPPRRRRRCAAGGGGAAGGRGAAPASAAGGGTTVSRPGRVRRRAARHARSGAPPRAGESGLAARGHRGGLARSGDERELLGLAVDDAIEVAEIDPRRAPWPALARRPAERCGSSTPRRLGARAG